MIPAIFFCTSIAHSHDLAAVMRSHGVPVYPLSGKTPAAERKRLIAMSREGEIAGLASCDAISIGFDNPRAMLAMMCRPTKSGLWYRQAVGRVFRPFPAPQGPRAYQDECLRRILAAYRRGVMSQLIVMPTGTGKTWVASQVPGLLQPHTKGRPRFMWLVHRDELAFQAAETFARENPGLTVGIEKEKQFAGDADIVVASIQTIGPEKTRRLEQFRPQDFWGIATDEAHVAVKSEYHTRTYRHFRVTKEFRQQEIVHLGWTATPNRADNIGLEVLFQDISFTYELRLAIQEGYLARLHAYRIETSVDISKVSTNREDFAQKPLDTVVNSRERNELVAQKYLEICRLEGMDGPMSNIGHKPHAIVCDTVDICGKHSLIVAPTLFGLRPRFDAKGGDILEQAEQIEMFEQQARTNLRDDAIDMAGIEATMRTIDLLAAPEVPEELAALSEFTWLRDGQDCYRLALLDNRMFTVRLNTLGWWEVYEHRGGVVCPAGMDRDLQAALRLAEEHIPGRDRMAMKSTAKWQSKAPKETQMLYLWKRDTKIKAQFPNQYAWFAFCKARYEAGDPGYTRGGISARISSVVH